MELRKVSLSSKHNDLARLQNSSFYSKTPRQKVKECSVLTNMEEKNKQIQSSRTMQTDISWIRYSMSCWIQIDNVWSYLLLR